MLDFSFCNRFIGVIALTLVAATCAGAPGAGERVLGEKDSGAAVALTAGETVRVQLPGNPTTGFIWAIGSVDTKVLKPVGEPAFESSNDLLGGGGRFTLTFHAQAPGTTTLKLVYRRPWEKDVAPTETFVVDVYAGANPPSGGQTQE